MSSAGAKARTEVARDLGLDAGNLNRRRREESQEPFGKKAFAGQGFRGTRNSKERPGYSV
jgi:hypothetical protein